MIQTLFSNPLGFVISVLALVAAIAIHEFSHAIAADRLGDPTPRLQGRVTLNPLAHLDKFGSLFLLLFGFGWGKPVVFDPFNLRNPRKDSAIISLAGPFSNFILAIICSILIRLFILVHQPILIGFGILILVPLVIYNILLGVFNLIPVSPLDGFKIVGGILSREQARQWYELERYGLIFLLLLIIPLGGSSMLQKIIGPPITFLIGILLPSSLGSLGV